jgi:hypothetical protein
LPDPILPGILQGILRALGNYRSRLTKRGIARFEVLGLDPNPPMAAVGFRGDRVGYLRLPVVARDPSDDSAKHLDVLDPDGVDRV